MFGTKDKFYKSRVFQSFASYFSVRINLNLKLDDLAELDKEIIENELNEISNLINKNDLARDHLIPYVEKATEILDDGLLDQVFDATNKFEIEIQNKKTKFEQEVEEILKAYKSKLEISSELVKKVVEFIL